MKLKVLRASDYGAKEVEHDFESLLDLLAFSDQVEEDLIIRRRPDWMKEGPLYHVVIYDGYVE